MLHSGSKGGRRTLKGGLLQVQGTDPNFEREGEEDSKDSEDLDPRPSCGLRPGKKDRERTRDHRSRCICLNEINTEMLGRICIYIRTDG